MMTKNKDIKIRQAQIDMAYELAMEGCSRATIAKALDMSIQVMISYDGVLYHAIKNGRAVYEEETAHKIQQALTQRALGYSFTETKNETDSDGKVKDTTMEKQQAPNVTAQEFYLINHSRKYKNEDWQSVNTVTLAEDSEKVDLLNKLAQHLQANMEEPRKVKKCTT